MEQHPVPQQISAYEFRLVGDMTLKQFFQLAGGVVIALLFYAAPLPAIIKAPLVLFFVLFGAALAFLPFEERPLSTWIIAFFKAVYSPTQYEFRDGGAEEVFAKPTSEEPQAFVARDQRKAQRYLGSIPVPGFLSALEEAEQAFMERITGLFRSSPSAQEQVAAPVTPRFVVEVEEEPRWTAPKTALEKPAEEEPRPFSGPAIRVEETPPVQILRQPFTQQVQPAAQKTAYQPENISPTLAGDGQHAATQATFNPEAAPPSPPEEPNTVVGQVLTKEGKIIEGAILEIRDSEGRPQRALKTNKVGHFMAVTPLPPGEYEVETEKEGFRFDNIKFRAEGNIIPPIKITAGVQTQ